MRLFILVLFLFCAAFNAHAALTRQLTKKDVGLSNAVETLFYEHTFVEMADADTFNIMALPANARIVQFSVRDVNMVSCNGTLLLGVDGDTGSIWPGQMIGSNTVAVFPSGLKYITDKTVMATASGATFNCAGEKMMFILQYVQE